jgi:hypothetical protein
MVSTAMLKKRWVVAASVITLAVLGIIVVCFGLVPVRSTRISRDEQAMLATPGPPVASPSGKYVLIVRRTIVEGDPHLTFELRAPGAGEAVAPLFQAADAYSDFHTTFFLWDDADRVWVYSGDVGTFFWERGDDGEWRKSAMVDRDVPAPPLLKKLRPKWH